MSWINTISFEKANASLKKIYNRVKGPNNNIDNVLLIHSLRPHTLTGHMSLYKNVLHNSNNSLSKWYLEAIGVYVSFLNHCNYCVDHHFAGLSRLLNNDDKANHFIEAVKNDTLYKFFDIKLFTGIKHAKKLTLNLQSVSEKDIQELKNVGFTDGEILEINQVTSYFNYVNRTVVGLGVTTEGDIIGLSPKESSDPDNWNHS